MSGYLPSTEKERLEMCACLGIESPDRLYDGVPDAVRRLCALDLPGGMGEARVKREVERMAGKNKVYASIFRGAGAEKHYIPAFVRSIAAREEFLTAYTPYQPEISQGILQSIYEFQSMVCELYGMDVANASCYDGASALAEAAQMCRERARVRVLISGAVNPRYIETVRTYAAGRPVDVIPVKDGRTDTDALSGMLAGDAACVIIQQPNFFGLIEDARAAEKAAHGAGAKLVLCAHPICAAVLETPGEIGADVCVGEGQPLGLELGYGGPYLGLMACKKEMMRKLPGRIVGETTDDQGRRAFVLTLQAREQHIRRERASSSLCSNQALCAMRTGAYLCAMGAGGLQEVAEQCHSKAKYLEDALHALGYCRLHGGEYFCEFLTSCPPGADKVLRALSDAGILGGLPVEGGMLWCVTEQNTKDDMDALVAVLKGVCA